eukprot:1994216-Rhodomonas_salina.1
MEGALAFVHSISYPNQPFRPSAILTDILWHVHSTSYPNRPSIRTDPRDPPTRTGISPHVQCRTRDMEAALYPNRRLTSRATQDT